MSKAKLIWLWVNMWRILPSLLAYRVSGQRPVIRRDLGRWIKGPVVKLPAWLAFCWVMLYSPEFRNLFYYRLKRTSTVLSCCLKPFLAEVNTLFIFAGEIGPGLYIQHGFSTIISADKIGEDCWINQQVTIGYTSKSDRSPVIGDRVTINAGAKVLGDLTVGDDSIIGANAVVVKNVPPKCTVVGVPARIIRRDGVRVDEPLL